MVSRRQFLGSLSMPAAAIAGATLCPARASAVLSSLASYNRGPHEAAGDEDFWFQVSQAYTVDRSIINLNNGGVSPATRLVQDAMKRHLDFSHKAPAHTMWNVLEPQRENVRERLAAEFGTDKEEIALTRNASEGLQTCQFGFDLQRGDEVLTTTVDYPRMINTFKQRERREGIVLKQFSIPTPCENPSEIVSLFEQNITSKTRMILVSHLVFCTGQILPVREVAALGRAKGIPVIIDGAHALAHFSFKISDLDCDYYATSLHKWLCAPHGTGLLYVRRNRIKDLWPLMAASEEQDENIRKFEEIGTHPAAPYLAIAEALSFHQGIGRDRKEARLSYLRDYWAKRLLRNDRVRLHTSLKPGFACAIAVVQIDGVDTGKLVSWLWKKHRIMAVAIKHEEFEGMRVSPNVYTMLPELDRFCEAVEHVIRNGLPA
ncbi:MAG: aminotransferase class V-fold PLP-dependent enzyme [Planctomycetes bacterium]|nr:aminotransferase class V-fold PLP-dependent enzyme [Planctomycetota bacterium]